MKIVLSANTSWYLYNFRRNLIAEIRKRDHEVYAIAPRDQHSEKLIQLGVRWFDIPLHQTSKNPVQELRAFIEFFRVLHKIKPEILLTFTIKCNIYLGLIARICNFAQIATISGLGEAFDRRSVFKILLRHLYKLALKSSQKVFFQNQEDLNVFVQTGILAERNCERVPGSGVDLTRFIPGAPQPCEEQRIFLMFGRIVPQKGYHLFLEAARKIQAEQTGKAEFWILGIQDNSRKASIELFQRILDYHHRKIITYMPPTDDVVPIVQQSHVVVLPSHYNEGVPRSLLEAMACGKPIITTNWKGCRETVDHGINGYLIERDNLQSLLKGIQFFIQAREETLSTMGIASRRKAEQEFDETIVISKYLAEISAYQLQRGD